MVPTGSTFTSVASPRRCAIAVSTSVATRSRSASSVSAQIDQPAASSQATTNLGMASVRSTTSRYWGPTARSATSTASTSLG
jgi:hypothetical protein